MKPFLTETRYYGKIKDLKIHRFCIGEGVGGSHIGIIKETGFPKINVVLVSSLQLVA